MIFWNFAHPISEFPDSGLFILFSTHPSDLMHRFLFLFLFYYNFGFSLNHSDDLPSWDSSLKYLEWTVGYIIIITAKGLLSAYHMAGAILNALQGSPHIKILNLSCVTNSFENLNPFPRKICTQEHPRIFCFTVHYCGRNHPQTTVFVF